MKNKLLLGIIGAIFIILIFFGIQLLIKHEAKITTSGIISAQEVEIASQISGTVEKVFVKEGETLSRGEIIAKIDDAELKLRLKNAQAQLAKAQSHLQLVQSGARPQEKRQAQAEVAAYKAKRDQAAKQLSRIRTLYHYGDVEKNQFDLARTEYIISQENYQGALAKYSLVRAGSRIEEINIARAEVEQAESQVQLLAKSVDDSLIKATIPGIVNKTVFNPGELITVGSTMASMINLDDVWVDIFIPEKEICLVKLGQRVETKVDSYPGLLFPGIVSHIENKAEFLPKNVQTKEDRVEQVFRVKVALTNRDHLLKAGIPADVEIILNNENSTKKTSEPTALAITKKELLGKGYLYKNYESEIASIEFSDDNDSLLFKKDKNNNTQINCKKLSKFSKSTKTKNISKKKPLSSKVKIAAKQKKIKKTVKISEKLPSFKKVKDKKIAYTNKLKISYTGEAFLFKKDLEKPKIITNVPQKENSTKIVITQVGLPKSRILSMEITPKDENIKSVTALFNKKYYVPLNKIGNNLWHCNYILPRKTANLPYPIKFIMKKDDGRVLIAKKIYKVEKRI